MPDWPSETILPGRAARLRRAPDRSGIVLNRLEGSRRRQKVYIQFTDGTIEPFLFGALEPVPEQAPSHYESIRGGHFGSASHLRSEITFRRLSGNLANLIYSLNTTNTLFLPYQFKPVLNFLDSPGNGLLIADEVGLGKTIEAGLIWTELKARIDARRLLIVCPAMLREKWVDELANRFGVRARIVDAGELCDALESASTRKYEDFALVASIQGLRPPREYGPESQRGAARLAHRLEQLEADDPVLDLVIIDEAHYLRNDHTRTSLLGHLLRRVTHHILLLSATPIQLRNRDLYNLLRLIDEDAFPHETTFDDILTANAPLVELRSELLASPVSAEDICAKIDAALATAEFSGNSQLAWMRDNLPTPKKLSSTAFRSEFADQLDRASPLGKVITRTLKRDVDEGRVIRHPRAIVVEMSAIEEDFYQLVTEEVRDYCSGTERSTGFLLTTPQRQMSSCMAAACKGWQSKALPEALEEVLYALGDEQSGERSTPQTALGELTQQLVSVSREAGSVALLRHNDSKYQRLLETLTEYWRENPGRKIVLFAFFRETLRYLHERLAEDGHTAALLYGGLDKNAIINQFRDTRDAKILLSSEVAAEGVDLQFSSVLINYDLPWNPMRIEQRIGRIDRIGQPEPQIFIWNFMYAGSIDERIHDRLLDRLDIFRFALGSMETVLGDPITTLTRELLSHKLTPDQERDRIDRAALALENIKRQHEELERNAVDLIAHGDFIQTKVRVARDLGRYLSGEDLFVYIREFLKNFSQGSRLVELADQPGHYDCELATELRVEFQEFLQKERLNGSTRMPNGPPLTFTNHLHKTAADVENITQEHPFIRFATRKQQTVRQTQTTGYQIHAIRLNINDAEHADEGHYAYTVQRWSASGAIVVERLAYRVINLDSGAALDPDASERLVNTAALAGKDWTGVRQEIDTAHAADVFDDCWAALEEEFELFSGYKIRENADRLAMNLGLLEKRRASQVAAIEERIRNHEKSPDKRKHRMIPAERGKIKKLSDRIEEKIKALELGSNVRPRASFVAGGVIIVGNV